MVYLRNNSALQSYALRHWRHRALVEHMGSLDTPAIAYADLVLALDLCYTKSFQKTGVVHYVELSGRLYTFHSVGHALNTAFTVHMSRGGIYRGGASFGEATFAIAW